MKYLIVNTRRSDDTPCMYCGKKLGKQYVRGLIACTPGSAFCSETCLDIERCELLGKYGRVRFTYVCAYCGSKKFGLSIPRHLRRRFCRTRCKDRWIAEREEGLRKRKFLAFLARPG